MGNDTRFYMAKHGDCIFLDDQACSRGRNRSDVFGVFWLACFRPDDFRPRFPDRLLNREFPHVVCPATKARKQFETGLAALREYFGDTDFDRKLMGETGSILEEFREELYCSSWSYAHMEISEVECNSLFLLLPLVLIGFDYPNAEFKLDRSLYGRWSHAYPPPCNLEVMKWAGTLRRLCIPSHPFAERYVDQYDSDSRDLYRLGISVDVHSLLVGGYGW